jgi:hypothetical protein
MGAAGVAALIGLWFWLSEASYASSNPGSELAGKLQWAGVGILMLGIAIGLLAWGVFRRSD